MRKRWRIILFRSLAIGAVSALVTLFPWFYGYFDGFENRVKDVAHRLTAAPSGYTSEVVLVLVDQHSLDWVNDNLGISWPWPRELHGAVIAASVRQGAKVIGVDILFTESSMYGVEDDRRLGEAIGSAPALALGSVTAGSSGPHEHWPEDLPLSKLSISGDAAHHLFPRYDRALLPVVEVARGTTVQCNTSQRADRDGIYRRMHPLVWFKETLLPPLGVGMFLTRYPDSVLNLSDGVLSIGSRTLPLDTSGQVHLRFRGPSGKTYASFGAASLIQRELLRRQNLAAEPDTIREFDGKYVLYGFSAPGLLDLRPTPMGGKTAGVELHATLLDNLLANDFLMVAPRWLELVGALGAILTAGLLLLRFSSVLQQFGLLMVLILLPMAIYLLLFGNGYIIAYVPLQFGLVSVGLLAVLLNYLTEGKERRFIKHMFRHYLSPEVIEELLQHPEKLRLGGERKEISIYFSDLQGFTTISEGLEPEVLTELLNTYLTAMSDIILAEGGTIDKYEGDAIIAFWNAPLSFPDHGIRAVRAALKCQKELARMRPELKKRCGHEVHMRIGLNTGEAVVGNLGSANRFDYTMLGDAANLAARLEGVNKVFGTRILISESTMEHVRGVFPARLVARVVVVGRKEPVRIYEPYTEESWQVGLAWLERFEEARLLFEKGALRDAQDRFELLAESDPVARAYFERCRGLLSENHSISDWSGVWLLQSK